MRKIHFRKQIAFGEGVVVALESVKKKLDNVRFVSKFERNLISVETLEEKGCACKTCDGAWCSRRQKGIDRPGPKVFWSLRSNSNLGLFKKLSARMNIHTTI